MKAIVKSREEGGRFVDIYDFLERIDPKLINKRAFENLAKAGAFDSIHPNRMQLVKSVDILMTYAQSLAAEKAACQVSLFDSTDRPAPKLPAITDSTGPERLEMELSAIGFYLSGHPLSDLSDVLRRRNIALYAEAIANAQEGHEAFKMVGIVRKRQERAAAKSGEKFAFVAFSDPSGDFEVMYLPESFRLCRDRLEVGASLVINVKAKGRDGEVRLFGETAQPLDEFLQSQRMGIKLHLASNGFDVNRFKTILDQSIQSEGGDVVVSADIPGLGSMEARLPGRFGLDASLRGRLKALSGIHFIEDV
jgi:DNA polymerase-3 subunit alpha